jgi:hypothetical protein
MVEDNVIPLVDPSAVEDEFTTDEYEQGYKEGIEVVKRFNAIVEEEFLGRDFDDDFYDGLYDAVVENFNI